MCVRPQAQRDSAWRMHREVIRISGFGTWLYLVLGLDWVEGWVSYLRNREYYEDMEYRFACALEHACGLSKTNYDVDTMRTAIDERQREQSELYLEEACDEGWMQRVDQDIHR